MTKTITVTITQELSKEIPVFAESEQEALEKAKDIYAEDSAGIMTDNDTDINTSFSV